MTAMEKMRHKDTNTIKWLDQSEATSYFFIIDKHIYETVDRIDLLLYFFVVHFVVCPPIQPRLGRLPIRSMAGAGLRSIGDVRR